VECWFGAKAPPIKTDKDLPFPVSVGAVSNKVKQSTVRQVECGIDTAANCPITMSHPPLAG